MISRFVVLGPDFAEAVEAALHQGATLGDPIGKRFQSIGLDPASANPPDFLAADETAFLKTWMCCTTAASVMSNGLAKSLTRAGPRLNLSTIARRVGSARARKLRSIA